MNFQLFIFATLIAVTFTAEVVVFGDSWGTYGEKAFEEMFSSRGYNTTVANVAVGGTTAAEWAQVSYH